MDRTALCKVQLLINLKTLQFWYGKALPSKLMLQRRHSETEENKQITRFQRTGKLQTEQLQTRRTLPSAASLVGDPAPRAPSSPCKGFKVWHDVDWKSTNCWLLLHA